MHCVLEGLIKSLLEVWVKGHILRSYISGRSNEIDQQLLKQCPPHDLTRAPRSIQNHQKFWKANEFRKFLLYYSFPLLVCVLPPLYSHHFGFLVCAMHILLQSQITDTNSGCPRHAGVLHALTRTLWRSNLCCEHATSFPRGTFCATLGSSVDPFSFSVRETQHERAYY